MNTIITYVEGPRVLSVLSAFNGYGEETQVVPSSNSFALTIELQVPPPWVLAAPQCGQTLESWFTESIVPTLAHTQLRELIAAATARLLEGGA